MANTTPITVAYGDGIGPEIVAATLRTYDGKIGYSLAQGQ